MYEFKFTIYVMHWFDRMFYDYVMFCFVHTHTHIHTQNLFWLDWFSERERTKWFNLYCEMLKTKFTIRNNIDDNEPGNLLIDKLITLLIYGTVVSLQPFLILFICKNERSIFSFVFRAQITQTYTQSTRLTSPRWIIYLSFFIDFMI